jgi:hypothetical protein
VIVVLSLLFCLCVGGAGAAALDRDLAGGPRGFLIGAGAAGSLVLAVVLHGRLF